MWRRECGRSPAAPACPVAYDSVGKDTFEATLASLARRGLFVSFGNASGPVPAFEPLRLSRAGSLFFTRPTMGDYTATRAELEESAGALFAVLASGKVRVEIGQRFKLADARQAHEALRGPRHRSARRCCFLRSSVGGRPVRLLPRSRGQRRDLGVHRLEEVVVGLGLAQLVEQELDRILGAHRIDDAVQDVGLLQHSFGVISSSLRVPDLMMSMAG